MKVYTGILATKVSWETQVLEIPKGFADVEAMQYLSPFPKALH